MSGSAHERKTDPIIYEMHGMVKELCVTVKEHIKRDEEIQAEQRRQIELMDTRLHPVENFHQNAQTVGEWVKWVLKYLSIPALTGIGIGIWAWIRLVLTHVPTTVNP